MKYVQATNNIVVLLAKEARAVHSILCFLTTCIILISHHPSASTTSSVLLRRQRPQSPWPPMAVDWWLHSLLVV